MNLSRRRLLQASLGAGQVALLAKMGLAPRVAHAATGGPTRLLTIYYPGGWMPLDLFCPLSSGEITRVLPVRTKFQNEPIFYGATDVTNYDGTGDALGPAGRPKLRGPRSWDATALAAGMPDPRTNGLTSPNGYAWSAYKLWENTCVVHGVDQGTAGHQAGAISAMCGIAGNDFRAPALHAHVASAMYTKYGDARPLPSVQLWEAPPLTSLDLRAEAAPIAVYSTQNLGTIFDEADAQAWAGFRGRTLQPNVDFAGTSGAPLQTTALEAHLSAQIRKLKGANAGTDALLKDLYTNYQGISSLMAKDVVNKIQATMGVQHCPRPFWAPAGGTHFALDIGGQLGDDGTKMSRNFTSVLQLLKSGVTSAIGVVCDGLNQFNFDTHPADGHSPHFVQVRAAFEATGRLLGEMKATPWNGGTLLDDTLVLLVSEFSRTWPNNKSCDHWQYTSVGFVGGGVTPNQMIGNYQTVGASPTAVGYPGAACPVIEETGAAATRTLRSADVVQTALRILGINNVRIPGGSGEIVGVRS